MLRSLLRKRGAIGARRFALVASLAGAGLVAGSAVGRAVTIDFEGPANGQELVGDEFAGVTISSPDKGVSHLGPTIFDSSRPGPNDGGADPDLLVNLGNILILQNTAYPTQTVPGIFDTPNDEADYRPTREGTVLFSFDDPIQLLTIDLIDLNGNAEIDITATDESGNTLFWDLPDMWTQDIDACGFTCDGFATFDLQSLVPQPGEPGAGGVAPAPDVTGAYDRFRVVSLELRFNGGSPSAAVDNLTFVPEPGTALLLGGGLAVLGALRRRERPARAGADADLEPARR